MIGKVQRAPLLPSQRFESEHHEVAELAFASTIQQRFNCRYHKLPIDWQIDGILSRNKEGIAFAELKCRSHNSRDYSTVYLSRHKMITGLKFSKHFSHIITGRTLPFIFFVRFLDEDLFIEVKESHLSLEPFLLDAQNHQNHKDLEYVVELPIMDFKDFSKKEKANE